MRGPDADCLVGEQYVLGIEIGGRVHRDGLDVQFTASAQDPQRDLASIGDDDFFDHRRYSMMNSG